MDRSKDFAVINRRYHLYKGFFTNGTKERGRFRKQDPFDCGNPGCLMCHGEKVFSRPSVADERQRFADEDMIDELSASLPETALRRVRTSRALRHPTGRSYSLLSLPGRLKPRNLTPAGKTDLSDNYSLRTALFSSSADGLLLSDLLLQTRVCVSFLFVSSLEPFIGAEIGIPLVKAEDLSQFSRHLSAKLYRLIEKRAIRKRNAVKRLLSRYGLNLQRIIGDGIIEVVSKEDDFCFFIATSGLISKFVPDIASTNRGLNSLAGSVVQ
jgi:hypothetical protein